MLGQRNALFVELGRHLRPRRSEYADGAIEKTGDSERLKRVAEREAVLVGVVQ